MASPTDQDVKLADKLAGVEGVVARRDAIAEALADAFGAGRAHGAQTAQSVMVHRPESYAARFDMFAAAALTGLVQRAHSALEDDIEDARDAAALMMQPPEPGMVAARAMGRKSKK